MWKRRKGGEVNGKNENRRERKEGEGVTRNKGETDRVGERASKEVVCVCACERV